MDLWGGKKKSSKKPSKTLRSNTSDEPIKKDDLKKNSLNKRNEIDDLFGEESKKKIETIKKVEKKRKFAESVECQVLLKDYDINKEKRLSGSVKLPHVPKANPKIVIIGDAKHNAEAQKHGLEFIDETQAASFKKDKKKVKKWAKK